jgi:asparagine synthase (glutamine-hydrolysing)
MTASTPEPGLCAVFDPDRPTAPLQCLRGVVADSPDGRSRVVLDGALLNAFSLASELCASGSPLLPQRPAEILLALYARLGLDCVQKLRGPFAFVAWDGRRLFVTRDRLGVHPLYYARIGRRLAFATRIKDLLAAGVEARIDPDGLRHFLLGVRAREATLFAGIRAVPPGHFLTIEAGQESLREYWDIHFPQRGARRRLPEREWVEGLYDALAESVRLHLPDPETPAALLLSGGIDSSMVAALALPHRRLTSYTITFHSPRYRSYDESEGAREVAALLGLDLREVDYSGRQIDLDLFLEVLWHFELPTYLMGVQTTLPFYLLYRRVAADGVSVALSGAGSDQILGGYLLQKLERIRRICERHPRSRRHAALYAHVWRGRAEPHTAFQGLRQEILDVYGHDMSGMAWVGSQVFLRELSLEILSPEWLAALGQGETRGALDLGLDRERYAELDPMDQLLYLEMKTRLPDYLLLEEYQIPAAFGLRASTPFVDHRVVEFAALIPPKVRMRGLRGKHVLKEASRRHFPEGFFDRPHNRGFRAPFGRDVLRNPKSTIVQELLSEQALREAGYFRPDAVMRLLRDYRDRRDPGSRTTHYFLLERALILQGLHHLFLRGGWRSLPSACAPTTGASHPAEKPETS